MKRRTYILAAGTGIVGALAGCLDGTSSDDGSSANNRTDDEDDEHEALAVVDAYFEASTEDDPDAIREHMHTYHPFNQAAADGDDGSDGNETEDGHEAGEGGDAGGAGGGFSYEPADAENLERELVDEEFDTDDVLETPGIEIWFVESDVSLEEVLEGEEAVLVEATYDTTEDGELLEETEQFIVLTDDGEWTVFFPYEEPTEVPDDEPVDDEEFQVVTDVEFDTETEIATIHLSGASDIEADELVAYSDELRQESSVWQEDAETLPSTTFFTTAFDPEGDEVVVTIRFDEDDEIVIHREAYEPTA